jgi:hypothetical protein
MTVSPSDFVAHAPAEAMPIRTNTLSIVALVAAFMIPVAAIILGHVALAQIKRTHEQGRGLALTGIIVGYVYSAFFVIFFIVWLTFLIFAFTQSGVVGR